jgi:hypothetical protein
MSATATHEANRSYRDVLRNQHVAGLGDEANGNPYCNLRPCNESDPLPRVSREGP